MGLGSKHCQGENPTKFRNVRSKAIRLHLSLFHCSKALSGLWPKGMWWFQNGISLPFPRTWGGFSDSLLTNKMRQKWRCAASRARFWNGFGFHLALSLETLALGMQPPCCEGAQAHGEATRGCSGPQPATAATTRLGREWPSDDSGTRPLTRPSWGLDTSHTQCALNSWPTETMRGIN